jgi:hypothetical protein
MSVTRSAIHKVQQGQTLAILVANYRLSSNAAILETAKNAAIRSQLAVDGELPVGLIVHIPPRAEDVLQERMHKLNELKPVLSAHFDTLQELTSANLLPALMNDTAPFLSDEVMSVLYDLGEFSRLAVDQISANSRVFVELGNAMNLTHVATSGDRALAASAGYAMAGLSWAISPTGLSSWQFMWARDLWDGKWESRSSDSAAQLTKQYITTVRSIAVQRADRHFRESLLLQRRLQSE